MSKRANPTLVGGFVIVAVVILVVGTVTFGGGKFFEDSETYIAYYDSSVKGLDVGAPVRFRGVTLGSVLSITATYDADKDEMRIPVVFTIIQGNMSRQIDERFKTSEAVKHFIEKGLRAKLAPDSLITGKLYVALDFYPDTEVNLVGGSKYVEFPTLPTDMEELFKAIEDLPIDELVANANQLIKDLDEKVASLDVNATAEMVDKLLADVQGLVHDVQAQVEPIAGSVRSLTENADGLIDESRSLVRNVDGEVKPLSESAQELVRTATDGIGDVQKLVRDVDERTGPLIESVEAVLAEAEGTLATLQDDFDEDSAFRQGILSALAQVSDAARSVRVLSEYIERHPEAFIRGKK